MSVEQLIHDAAMKIMHDVGVQIHNEEAIGVFQKHGVAVKDITVHLTEDQIWHWVKMAPSEFTLYGRNPKYDLTVGGKNINTTPTYGGAFILDRDGTVRKGNLNDFVRFARAVHGLDEYKINGGPLIVPNEVATDTANIDMFYATLLNSDKISLIANGPGNTMEAIVKVGCELYGGEESFIKNPRMLSLINTNSPLSLEDNMLQCLMIFAKYGQPVIVCPAAMLGATAPLSIAGTLASNTAEVLAGICLAEMVRPGTPVCFGVQSTAMDMRTAGFACAAPEGALMQGFGSSMARFYGVPSRGGGSQSDSPIINVQAGYESMLTYYSAYTHGINLIMIAGGTLDSCNTASLEKLLIDAEIIRQVQVACSPFEVGESTLAMEDIKTCAHKADFINCDNTLDNYNDLYSPRIGSRSRMMTDEMFNETLEKRMVQVLEKAEKTKPSLDASAKENVKEILSKTCGIDKCQLSRIEEI